MKHWIVGIVLVLLCGCGIKEADLATHLDETIEDASAIKYSGVTNHRRDYFDYYLPKHLGTRFSSMDSVIFVRNQTEFYMTLDVPSIIIQRYYSETTNSSLAMDESVLIGDSVYHKTGSMANFYASERAYELSVEKIDSQYLVLLTYGKVKFAAILPLAEIEETVYDMLSIGRSVVIDSNAVLRDFSNKDVTIITNRYNLFESVFPESGVIAHVINGNQNSNVHEEEEESDESLDDIRNQLQKQEK